MNQEGNRMRNGKALMLAVATAVAAGCASGGAGPTGADGVPETAATRAATVHLVQASLQEGEAAMEQYRQAHAEAMRAVEESPDNPKAYLVAGQSAVGLHDWVQADTMFDRAVRMHPPYEETVEAEREQGWVTAYNLGAEALNAEDTDRALEMFQAADMLYQGRPEARIALASLYVNRGELDTAAETYLRALEILSQDAPEGFTEEQAVGWRESRQIAALNAAELLAQTGDHARAADVLNGYIEEYGQDLDAATMRRARTALAGFYAQAGESERAEAMYGEILGGENLSEEEYFQAGIGFFNTGDYARAADAFRTAADMNTYSRDARLNLVQALYSLAIELESEDETPARNQELVDIYREVQEVGAEVREMDPLNRNLVTFVLRSYRSLADLDPQSAERLTQQAQNMFRDYQNQPYGVSDITVNMQGQDQARIAGTLMNLNATAGSAVQLRFELLDRSGRVMGSGNIDITAPAQGESTSFSESISIQSGEFAGWRYEHVQ
jgi:tetratricopeptide (TPR) repeat protein